MRACQEQRWRLHAYVDRELAASERLEFEQHLEACPACREAIRELTELVSRLRAVHPLYEVPPSLQSWAREQLQPFGRMLRVRRWIAAAVVCLAFLVAMSLWRSHAEIPAEVVFATRVHQRYLRGELPLQVRSDRPELLSQWLYQHCGLGLQLPNYPSPKGHTKAYRLIGARKLDAKGGPVALLVYELDGEPISLVMRTAAQPSDLRAQGASAVYRLGGLDFHLYRYRGFQTICWSDKGLSYSLVTSLRLDGSNPCVLCHGGGQSGQPQGWPQ